MNMTTIFLDHGGDSPQDEAGYPSLQPGYGGDFDPGSRNEFEHGSVLRVFGEDTEFRALKGMTWREMYLLDRYLQVTHTEFLIFDRCWSERVARFFEDVPVIVGLPARLGDLNSKIFIDTWFGTLQEGLTATESFEVAFEAIEADLLPSAVQPVLQMLSITPTWFRSPQRRIELPIGFGTNRELSMRGEFTSEFGMTVKGVATVAVWLGASVGGLPVTSRVGDDFHLLSHMLMDDVSFFTALSSALDEEKSSRRAVVVYVHGYNTGFVEAAQRAAQLHMDLKVPGVTTFFGWPSAGRMVDYVYDEEAVALAERPLYDFLSAVSNMPNVGPISVIAHSMGSRAVIRAMVRATETKITPFKIRELIFAAPDIHDAYFRQVASTLPMVAGRTTIYTSLRDSALGASAALHGTPRLGRPDSDPMPTQAGITFVAAEDVDVSFLGHGYYAASEHVLRDINWLLYGRPDSSRTGVTVVRPGFLSLERP